MGLFGSIFGGLTGAIGDIFGASSNAKAVKDAAAAQTDYLNKALGLQQTAYDTTTANEKPFLDTGTNALGSLSALLGLNGNGPQGSAIDALKGSPLFTSQYDTGQDTILQNAAATGGLRGGNTNNSLAQFGSSLLAQILQQQVGNLGGLVTVGQNAAGAQATAGQNFANSSSNILGQQGNVAAGSILGQQGVYNNLQNSLSALLKSAIGGGSGGASSLLGGGF